MRSSSGAATMVTLCFAVFVAVVAAAVNPAELSLAVPAGVPPRRTPVMAWNAWNTFSINGKPLRGGRKEYETIAEAMVDSGMVAAGYTLLSTVCTDWTGRDPTTHELQQNLTLWPGGMASFAEYLHGKGMQLSVYTDAGVKNCCQEPGSLGFEEIDMKTFASWGVDAVGIDYCGGPAEVRPAYEKFAEGIAKSGRGMQLGMWNLGQGRPWSWAPEMSRSLAAAQPGAWVPHFRLTSDIGNLWEGYGGPTMGVITTVDVIQAIPDVWGYGVGNESGTYPNYGQMTIGVPRDHPTIGDSGLTLVEAQSHFSMWCMFPTMLMATNDVRLRDPDIEAILLNNETIAVNQDPWGLSAFRINAGTNAGRSDLGTDPRLPTQLQWARHLANGDIAALILNRDNATQHATLKFADFLPGVAGGAYHVRDLQVRKDLGVKCQSVSFVLPPHGTAFVRLTNINDTCALPAPKAPVCRANPRPHLCKSCTVPSQPCSFPVPPLPPCPSGFTEHPSGFWSNADQASPGVPGKTVDECGALCSVKAGCKAFEVYDPQGVTVPRSGCYTFTGTLKQPFTNDKRGLIRTCTKG